MKPRLLSAIANILAWLCVFLLSWLIYAQFDAQTGRAGICAAGVTLIAMLQILFWTQKGQWLDDFTLAQSLACLAASIMLVTLKGTLDLAFAGLHSPSALNIQIAMNKSPPWGMLMTLVLAIIFVTGFSLTSLRLAIRSALGLSLKE
ncbi:MAG: hypothetical protein JNM76_01055 [Betaproteobacteria bacterium]|nr:hypothetical protein [Betaproteobacteria bacterium]